MSSSLNNCQSARTVTVITYRYKNKMVYVSPPDSHQVRIDASPSIHLRLSSPQIAIECARKEFSELTQYDSDRIGFYVNVQVKGQNLTTKVRIGDSAWQDVMKGLVQHEIVEIAVDPPIRSPRAHLHDIEEAPPSYPHDEKYLTVGDSKSREPSRSRSGSRSPRNIVDRALGWMKNPSSENLN